MSPRSSRRRRFGGVLATAATVIVVVGTVIGVRVTTDGGAGSAVAANVFAVASSGNPNCARSATLITYEQAVAAGGGAICGPGVRTSNGSIDGTSFGNACHAATSNGTTGDIVAVKNGNYAQTQANGFLFAGNLDCADGNALDYNPNWEEQGLADQTGRQAAWVKFVPGDTSPAITFNVGSFTIPQGNYHMIWEGIDVNTGIRFNYGGEEAGQWAQNIIIRGNSRTDLATIYGVAITGSKNILLKDINNGPSNQCARNDPLVPVAWRCNPSGPWFEAQYANVGAVTSACNMTNGNHIFCGGFWANGGSEWAELYIHDGGSPYENIRLENYVNHDQQSIQDSVVAAHPGCLMSFDTGNVITSSHNLVLDGYVCERPTGASIQLADSGVTIQNSVFGCQVRSLQNTGGIWDGACSGAAFGWGRKTPSGGATNVLIRYNYFGASEAFNGLTINTSASGSYSDVTNMRVVGNVFADTVTCGVSGVTYDSNTFVNGVSTCGTNATSLGAGDPIVNSSYDTPDNLYKLEGATIDAHADGSPALPTFSLSGDLNLNHDADRDTRSGTTRPGVDH
jgi:hypothetical protein